MRCMICFTTPDTMEEILLFRECRHAFCKVCIRSHAEHIIQEGTIERLVCPGFDELTNKACPCKISQ